MDDTSRLAIHTMTTKPWDLPTACSKYSAAGVSGVGLWRQWLEGRALAESKRLLDDHGLCAVSLVRGGFFPGESAADRNAAIDENRKALDEAAALGANVVILTVSVDLPMAQARWCGAAGVEAVETLSDYKDHTFGNAYGVRIKELGLLTRAVFVIDGSGQVTVAQIVPEVTEEPDYAAVLEAAKG